LGGVSILYGEMADEGSTLDLDAVRRRAAASGIELSDDRAEALTAGLARHRTQVERFDRLDLDEREPGVADPAAGR
jgi:hypothetical protein